MKRLQALSAILVLAGCTPRGTAQPTPIQEETPPENTGPKTPASSRAVTPSQPEVLQPTVAKPASSEPPSAGPPKLTFELKKYAGSIFKFPASIREDGRIVVMLLDYNGGDGEAYFEQRLIAKSVAGDNVVRSFLVFDGSWEGNAELIDKGETEALVPRYQKIADEVNQWLSGFQWRRLAEPPKGWASHTRDTVQRGERCTFIFAEPHLQVFVGEQQKPVVDRTFPSWSYRAPEKHCWSSNTALLSVIGSDLQTGVFVFKTDFLGGHTGCQAPFPDFHAIRSPPLRACL